MSEAMDAIYEKYGAVETVDGTVINVRSEQVGVKLYSPLIVLRLEDGVYLGFKIKCAMIRTSHPRKHSLKIRNKREITNYYQNYKNQTLLDYYVTK